MTQQTPQGTPAPGWYPTAEGSAQLRWWDGTQWTDQYHLLTADPAQQNLAPEGTKPNTAWIWIFVLLPLLQLAELPFLANLYTKIFAASLSDPTSASTIELDPSSGYLALQGVSLLLYGIWVVLAVFDYRSLKARGVPRPFHWGWTFLSSIVYIIGRTVVVRRRTGRGMAPLWVYIATFVIELVATFAVLIPILTNAVSTIGTLPN